MILATIACGLTMIDVTCNGQISILIPIEMLRGTYIESGLHAKNLNRTGFGIVKLNKVKRAHLNTEIKI